MEKNAKGQIPYDAINFDEMPPQTAELVRALIPFAEMDRPGELRTSGPGSDENLQDVLENPSLIRGSSSDLTLLTNGDFRRAAKVLFDLTGAVPDSYFSYEIEFN
jgi:hypothetical protein